MKRIKVLMLNGTSAAVIQALTLLDPNVYEMHVCDSNPQCRCRFHRNCAQFFESPHLGSDPKAFFEFTLQRLQSESYDVILPVHEEGLLLAKYQHIFKKYTKFLLGDIEAYHTIMNKRLCLELAQSLGIPIPPTKIAHSLDEVKKLAEYPCYVKLPYGTSSSGVKRIASSEDCIPELLSFVYAPEFIIQKEIIGDLCQIQSIFVEGKMIASHQWLALALGFGGSGSRRVSINRDDLRKYARLLGSNLHWSGPLMLDFILDHKTDKAYLIEGNPRIGETFNATLAGLNICDMLIKLSLGKSHVPLQRTREGVRTHQMFSEIQAATKRDESLARKYLIAFSALARVGKYKGSTEELIHPRVDPISLQKTFDYLFRMPCLNKEQIAAGDSKTTNNMSAGAYATTSILKSHWSSIDR